MNNIAIVYKHLGNQVEAKECLDYLLSFLMIYVDQGCGAELRYLQVFLVNVTADKGTMAAPAA